MEPLSDHIEQGVYLLSVSDTPFCHHYQSYLQKTNRRYDDAEVREFPNTFFYNLHRQEWTYRAQAFERLRRYLKRKESPKRILDLGCGTGWLSARLANLPEAEVVGLDHCLPLVRQAARIFSAPNLQYACGDIFEDILPPESFDFIILFDTISWFPNLPQLINRCRQFLRPDGELHILESPLWTEKQRDEANQATESQFAEAGISDLTHMYHHHLSQELSAYDYTFLYRLSRWKKWLGSKDSPYPWVRVLN